MMKLINSKNISIQYLYFSVLSAALGAIFNSYILFKVPHLDNFSAIEQYYLFSTAHHFTIFFMLMSILFSGFGTLFISNLVGTLDMAFPTIKTFAASLLLKTYNLYLLAVLTNLAITNLFRKTFQNLSFLSDFCSHSMLPLFLMILCLIFISIFLILSSINFIVTILFYRDAKFKLFRLPLYIWSILITSFLLLLAFFFLVIRIIIFFFSAEFFISSFEFLLNGSSDIILLQDLLRFLGHPEVFILILPAFGVISQVIERYSNRAIFGYYWMVFAMIAIGFLGFIGWMQHIFAFGLYLDTRAHHSTTAIIIAVLIVTKIFCWITTMCTGRVSLISVTPMYFAIGSLFLFTIGGFTGVLLPMVGFGVPFYDTFNVVGHFHYILFMGVVSAMFAGLYNWCGIFTGFKFDEEYGIIHFSLFFMGVIFTFFPMYLWSLERIPDFLDTFEFWNVVSSYGETLSFTASLWFFYVIYAMFQNHIKCD